MSDNGKLLVVEDDFGIRTALVRILEQEGFAVVAAANGVEALERLRQDPAICFVLLDLLMPTMSGWEFRRAQLQDPKLARIPVVAMTAGNRPTSGAESVSFDGYLPKPLQLDIIIGIVERYCRRKAS